MRVLWREPVGPGSRTWRILVAGNAFGSQELYTERSARRRFSRIEPRLGWAIRAGIQGPISAFIVREPWVPEVGENLHFEDHHGNAGNVDALRASIQSCQQSDSARQEVVLRLRSTTSGDAMGMLAFGFWRMNHALALWALDSVDAYRQSPHDGRQDGGKWFISDEDLQLCLGLLDEPIDVPLEGQWQRTSQAGLRGSNVVETWFLHDRRALVALLGPPHRYIDGFCHKEQWGLRAPSGREFVVHRCTEAHSNCFELIGYTVIGEEWNSQTALLELADLLDIQSGSQSGGLLSPARLPHRWRVMRLDDNGNEFEVSRHHSEKAAKRRASAMESHGHKQAFWAEPIPRRGRT